MAIEAIERRGEIYLRVGGVLHLLDVEEAHELGSRLLELADGPSCPECAEGKTPVGAVCTYCTGQYMGPITTATRK